MRIGTRGSPLALVQARLVATTLAAAHAELAAPDAIEIVPIRTTGDRVQDRTLAEIGGKGLFTKELDEALLERRVDIAVHSMKDVPTWLPEGLAILAMLPREDPRDAFISPRAASLDALPQGAVIGTASLRRQAQLLHRRPDLTIVPLRGNVDTRLAKLANGACDATLLAMAGLVRLGRGDAVTAPLGSDVMLPAVAQGAIGIAGRTDDTPTRDRLAAIDHAPTARRVAAERALLAILDGSCRTPIAALADFDALGRLLLEGMVVSPDGRGVARTQRVGDAVDAERIGRDAGAELKRTGGHFIGGSFSVGS
jgi:hydroxymethylbilane synthase